MKANVVEIVLFKPKAGVTDEALVKAAAGIDEFTQDQAGFLKRELAQTEDGQWIDIVHWTDMASAHHAAEAAMSSPICLPFFSLIDESTINMNHYTVALS